MAIFEKLTAKDDADTQLLLTAAILSGFAHNLDIEGAADNAVKYYERILKREPNHPRANYHYGRFLASASKPRESLPYLEKALRSGVEEARYTLGLTYLTMGDKEKALDYLNAYSRNNPDNQEAKKLIEALKSGGLKIQTEAPVKQ
jgi:Tfp pilus assembly protein PilF